MKSLNHLLRKYRIKNFYLSLLILCACVSTVVTYFAITRENLLFDADKNKAIISLIIIDIVIFAALIATIFHKLNNIFKVNKSQPGGSLLLRKIVLMFSLGTAIPTAIIAIFAFIFFNYGIHSWFNDKVSTALNESVAVAEAYLKEHKENIKSEALAMANDMNINAYQLMHNPELFANFIETQSQARSLYEIIVFRWSDKRILAQSRFSFSLRFALENLTEADIDNVDKQQAIILADEKKIGLELL